LAAVNTRLIGQLTLRDFRESGHSGLAGSCQDGREQVQQTARLTAARRSRDKVSHSVTENREFALDVMPRTFGSMVQYQAALRWKPAELERLKVGAA
jgi:hypothetical protein